MAPSRIVHTTWAELRAGFSGQRNKAPAALWGLVASRRPMDEGIDHRLNSTWPELVNKILKFRLRPRPQASAAQQASTMILEKLSHIKTFWNGLQIASRSRSNCIKHPIAQEAQCAPPR